MTETTVENVTEILRQIIPQKPDWRVGFTGQEYVQVRLSKEQYERACALLKGRSA